MTLKGKYTHETRLICFLHTWSKPILHIEEWNKLAYLLQINADYRKLNWKKKENKTNWTEMKWNEAARSVSPYDPRLRVTVSMSFI